MVLAAVLMAIGTLIFLISVVKLHPFVAFLIAAIAAALLLGRPIGSITTSLNHGIGDILGSLTSILRLGAMFGKIVADSGAARQIADTLIRAAGTKRITIAMACAGFVIGIPLFYNVGFVLMVPLILSVQQRSRLPMVYLAIPLLSGLSIAHGFLPPHPSPTALVGLFGADMGRTLVFGLIVGIPTLLIAGPLFAFTLKGMIATADEPLSHNFGGKREAPGVFVSFFVALLPVVLLGGASLVTSIGRAGPAMRSAAAVAGDANVVMLGALLVAIIVLGFAQGQKASDLSTGSAHAIKEIAGILLVIAGAGALKQVFVDGGADVALAGWLAGLHIPPLVLGWTIALAIRLALGSATIAGLTAAGMVEPLVASQHVDPSLMVLAIGAGSLMCSHVNDSGFWMFKEYFGLSMLDTFRSWSVMETLVGAFGLLFTLILSSFI